MSSIPLIEMQRVGAKVLVCFAVVVAFALALSAPRSSGAVVITGYGLISNMPSFPAVPSAGPSTVQAGANPDAGSFTTFAYMDGSEDLKTALVDFGPGLLANPESVPKCPQAALEAGGSTCPAGSAIGRSRLDANLAGSPTHAASFEGTLYNAEPLGNEPSRVAAVTYTSPTRFVLSSIPFGVTPRGGGDYGVTATLTDIDRLPSPPNPSDLQITALGFVMNGSTNRYVRNPTSCGLNLSRGQAIGYVDPTVFASPTYGFATNSCGQLPFAPKVSITIGDRGSTAFRSFPPFVFRFTQAAGEADVLGTKLTLPIELNSNSTAYRPCSQRQADADSCPAESKVGWVKAKSPFLDVLSQGPIYLVQETPSSLPGLLLDFHGRVHVKVQTRTSLINNKRIQSLVLNAPQLPVAELTVALDGGRKGLFLNRQDLCFRGVSTTKFNDVTALSKLYGWNGKQTVDEKIRATVLGCGPAVKAEIRGAKSRRPEANIAVINHPDAVKMKALAVRLSRGIALSKRGLSRSKVPASARATLEYVNRHSFRVTGLPAAGVGSVTIRLRKRALRLGKRSRRSLERGNRNVSIKVTPTPIVGEGTSTRTKFNVNLQGERRGKAGFDQAPMSAGR
jgi:hypothetical protein